MMPLNKQLACLLKYLEYAGRQIMFRQRDIGAVIKKSPACVQISKRNAQSSMKGGTRK